MFGHAQSSGKELVVGGLCFEADSVGCVEGDKEMFVSVWGFGGVCV